MRQWAVVRYKADQIYGSTFRDLAGRDRYIYNQPNALDGEQALASADVMWFESEKDAVAACELASSKVNSISFCVMECKDIMTSVVLSTKVSKCKFTEKGLLPT